MRHLGRRRTALEQLTPVKRVLRYSGESNMLNRRVLISFVASIAVLVAAGVAAAKNQHHNNGHNLLGAKLNQDGKHQIDKAGNATVTAEVRNKKVVNMSAGSLPVQKEKSKKKMAGFENIQVATNGEIQLGVLWGVLQGDPPDIVPNKSFRLPGTSRAGGRDLLLQLLF